ncbi:hypothetical protein ACPV5T_02225 [Vibrio astriarenae]
MSVELESKISSFTDIEEYYAFFGLKAALKLGAKRLVLLRHFHNELEKLTTRDYCHFQRAFIKAHSKVLKGAAMPQRLSKCHECSACNSEQGGFDV